MPTQSPYKQKGLWGLLIVQVLILAGIGAIGYNAGIDKYFSRREAWLLILALMTIFAVLAGLGITGYWRGILIDSRFKMSLSRLQLLAWTLIILSAIITAGLTNASFNAKALAIEIPPEIWALLGISTASAVASPAVLSSKRNKKPDVNELNKTMAELAKDQVNIDTNLSGVVLRNDSPDDARWGDLLKGEESGNASVVDLGKLQMFFFTFVLVVTYGVEIARIFDSSVAATALPQIDNSMNMLLGISHTGYLSNKAVSHSREEGAASPPAGDSDPG